MWVSRDDGKNTAYDLWIKKPSFTYDEDYKVFYSDDPNADIITLCPEEFELFTDLKLKPGQCVKIRGRIHFERESK